jgi:hypothetical protein
VVSPSNPNEDEGVMPTQTANKLLEAAIFLSRDSKIILANGKTDQRKGSKKSLHYPKKFAFERTWRLIHRQKDKMSLK